MPKIKKTWIPADYVDKVSPPGRPHPNAWMVFDKDFNVMLDEPFDGDGYGNGGKPLAEGDIIKFEWTAKLGRGEVTCLPNGPDGETLFECTIEPFAAPEGAMVYVWIPFDHDTMSDELLDIVDHLEVGEEETIQYFCWSGPIPFVFLSGAFHPASEPAAPDVR